MCLQVAFRLGINAFTLSDSPTRGQARALFSLSSPLINDSHTRTPLFPLLGVFHLLGTSMPMFRPHTVSETIYFPKTYHLKQVLTAKNKKDKTAETCQPALI